MYYVTKDLLKQLPEESRMLIEKEGITSAELDQMPEEEKTKLMDDNKEVVEAPTTKDTMASMMGDEMGEMKEKPDDSSKLPKPVKYGDENEYENELTANGRMEELPDSKKNAIDSFEEANKRGNALIDELAKPKKKMKKEKIEDVSDEDI